MDDGKTAVHDEKEKMPSMVNLIKDATVYHDSITGNISIRWKQRTVQRADADVIVSNEASREKTNAPAQAKPMKKPKKESKEGE